MNSSDNIREKEFQNKLTYLSFCLAVLVVVKHAINVDVYELSRGGKAHSGIHRKLYRCLCSNIFCNIWI